MEYHYSIAQHLIRLVFDTETDDGMQLLPSFQSFQTDDKGQAPLFTLHILSALPASHNRQLIKSFDTGNGNTIVWQTGDGYDFEIHDIQERQCCLLQTNTDFTDCVCTLSGTWPMRSFGLNAALMLVFSFVGAYHDTLLIHASCVEYGGYGYPFIAKSGTGKSTHSNLWLQHIENCSLLNDDNPVVRIQGRKPYIYGSPWSGKTPCYRNKNMPLGAVTHIERAKKNHIQKLAPVQAFASLLPACSSMSWAPELYHHLCDTITKVIEATSAYTLYCLPDQEAAQLCRQTITR